jgi:pimeloyl-ACP methyl ester carboxylesterase
MLYFIHGYQSSPTGEKATLLQRTLHAIPITYHDGACENLKIATALRRISEIIRDDDHVVLIGSSLGGFLAASTALSHPSVKRLILLNPAIIPPDVDLGTISGMPRSILEEMRDPRLFEQKISIPIIILRGVNDDVVPDHWICRFALAQDATIYRYDDDHRFTKNLHRIPMMIAEML